MSTFIYPLDVTGSALSNRVRGEYQTLQPPTQSDNFHFILPRSGPYYRDTLKITHVPTGRRLIRGIDWEAGHYFHSASYETESIKGGIYQSILFLDRSLSGQIHLEEYFVLGGEWSLNENKILEVLSNRLADPRVVTYEQISGKPDIFPPIEHMHPAGDLTGMREQVEATYQVSAAIREQTDELPGKLTLVLENYYNRSQVDAIVTNLTQNLLEGIAGPELEQMLQDIALQMLGSYYTKAQIDNFVTSLNQKVSSTYYKSEIDLLLDDKLNINDLQPLIEDFVTSARLIDELTEVTKLIPELGRIDDIERSVDDLLELVKDVNLLHSNRLQSIEAQLPLLVRKDELDGLIVKSDIELLSQPCAEYYDDGVGSISNVLDFTISNVVLDDGVPSSLTINIPQIGYFNIVPLSPTGRERGVYSLIEKNIDVDFLALVRDNFGDQTLKWSSVKEYILGVVLRATVVLIDNSYEINYKTDLITVGMDEMEFTLQGPFEPTTQNDIILGYVNFVDGNQTILKYKNYRNFYLTEVKEIPMSPDDIKATGTTIIDFDASVGMDSISNISEMFFKSPDGSKIPLLGFKHDYIPRIKNTLEIYRPGVDLSHLGTTEGAVISVKCVTRSIGN